MEAAARVRPLVNADYEGWLRKEGSRVRSWKRRYFVLKGADLFYYEKQPQTVTTDDEDGGEVGSSSSSSSSSSNSVTPAGHMSVAGACVQRIGESDKPEYHFVVETAARTLHCAAASAAEMENWMDAIAERADVDALPPGGAVGGADEWWAEPVDLDGYLSVKDTPAVAGWKRRWFALVGRSLYYFRAAPDYEAAAESSVACAAMAPLGVLRLGPQVALELGAAKHGAHHFAVVAPHRRLELFADDEDVCGAWVGAVRVAADGDAGCSCGRSGLDWDADVEWSGFLDKRGAKNPGWKRRWFALRGGQLHYFKAAPPAHAAVVAPTGSIDLAGGSADAREDLGREHCFLVVQRAPPRSYVLSADTAADRSAWLVRILAAVSRLECT